MVQWTDGYHYLKDFIPFVTPLKTLTSNTYKEPKGGTVKDATKVQSWMTLGLNCMCLLQDCVVYLNK